MSRGGITLRNFDPIKPEKEVIRPDTCSKCKNGELVPVSKGNPRVVYCTLLNKRFVADSIRNCIYAI